MKFTQGQIVFLLFFLVVFIAAGAWAYLRDRDSNTRYYQGSWRILLGIIVILALVVVVFRIAKKLW